MSDTTTTPTVQLAPDGSLPERVAQLDKILKLLMTSHCEVIQSLFELADADPPARQQSREMTRRVFAKFWAAAQEAGIEGPPPGRILHAVR